MSAVLVLMGPTASGKTELAIELARRLRGEIVSADSRQIYRGMAVGTAQPDAIQRAAVPHHLVGMLEPEERYSAAHFVRDAAAAIEAIEARGRRPIVVGGTGFYVRALTGEMPLAQTTQDEALRARMGEEARIHPPAVLHAWLRALDPERSAEVAPADRYRTLRALEVALARREDPGASLAAAVPLPTLAARGARTLKAALAIDRERLAERVRRRTRAMIDGGLLAEAEALEGRDAPAADAVGYPQALAYLRGMCTRGELDELLARATMRYAKRQMTWLRAEPSVRWIPAGAEAADAVERAARETLGWT
ncbi:MAG TPA: tRNA (adenosine(37)-N6)-dimethylallyltransferase MiaA [Candidatus Dormibacteraeota bacterium]|nr:tRNA (adenosine(37)-N6)-dimethylallyltransferase MiaA [Candidatus Dormibacteraeota bacterium]